MQQQQESLRCSVPYVIPTTQAEELGVTRLNAVDAFRPRRWEGRDVCLWAGPGEAGTTTEYHSSGGYYLRAGCKVRAPIIHYAYGDDSWTKRSYHTAEQAAAIWETRAETTPGTILDEILTQIQQAGEFYRDPSRQAFHLDPFNWHWPIQPRNKHEFPSLRHGFTAGQISRGKKDRKPSSGRNCILQRREQRSAAFKIIIQITDDAEQSFFEICAGIPVRSIVPANFILQKLRV